MGSLFTPQDVAKVLKIDQELVLAHIRSGRLAAANVGQGTILPRWRISAESIDAFLNARGASTPKPARRRKPAAAAIEFFK